MTSSELNFTVSGITARLFTTIEKMSEDQKKELLILVGDQRKFTRKPFLMSVSYKTESGLYSDFILDISPGGTFIETNEDFFTGQEISLSFHFKNMEEPFNVNGCIVWQSNNGIGVKFIFQTKEQQKKLEEIISCI